MIKILLIFVFAVSAVMCFNSCSDSGTKNETEQTTKVEYTCSMHQEVIQDKPGQCSKCGMDLIEKKVDNQMDSTAMR